MMSISITQMTPWLNPEKQTVALASQEVCRNRQTLT